MPISAMHSNYIGPRFPRLAVAGEAIAGNPPTVMPAAARNRQRSQGSDAPGYPGQDYAGSGAGGVAMTPMLQNALAARKAADYAGGAPSDFNPGTPLPKTDADSAYGSVELSRNARYAFVQDQKRKADLLSGNFFSGRDQADDATNRANAQSAADVALTGTKGEVNLANAHHTRTDADVVMPSVADKNYAAAAVSNANATATPDLTRGKVAGMMADAGKKTAEGQSAAAGAAQHKELLAAQQKQLTAANQRIKDLESKLYARPGRSGGNSTDALLNSLGGDPATTGLSPITPATPGGVQPPGPSPAPLMPGAGAASAQPMPTPLPGSAAANASRQGGSPMLNGGNPAHLPGASGGQIMHPSPSPASSMNSAYPRTPDYVEPAEAAHAQPRQLDAQQAAAILSEAGGDKAKARQLAQSRGLAF